MALTQILTLPGYWWVARPATITRWASFVAGIEGDWDYTNARGGKACPNAFFFSCENDADQLGSIAARLGYTWGRALFYAKGGWAFGEVSAQAHSESWHDHTGMQPRYAVQPPTGQAAGRSVAAWNSRSPTDGLPRRNTCTTILVPTRYTCGCLGHMPSRHVDWRQHSFALV